MSLQEKLQVLEKYKVFFCNERYYKYYADWSLIISSIHGSLNIVKYILTNYIDGITNEYINHSIKYAEDYNHLNIVRCIRFYQTIRDNNTCPGTYKNIVIML